MNVSTQSFPHAPKDWSIQDAEAVASSDGITMTNEHWELVGALQEYYKK